MDERFLKRALWTFKRQFALCNYRPQRSCGKVMFLHLSVILFIAGFSVQGVLCLGVSLSRGCLCPGWVSLSGRPPVIRVGGMHTTGTHSCFYYYFYNVLITYSQANYQLVQECKEITRFLGPCMYGVTDELRSELDNLSQNL